MSESATDPPVQPPEHPALAGLSPAARSLFDALAAIPEIRVAEADLTGPEGSGEAIEALSHLGELADAGLLVRWTWDDRDAVTLSPLSTEILDVRPNIHGTRWVDRKSREPRVKLRRRKLEDGTEVVNETDMAIDPPGQLDQQSDPGAADPSEAAIEADEAIREAERDGGYTRPLFLMGCDMAWPVAQQDRGPLAPDPGPVPAGHRGQARDLPGPCGGCGGTIGQRDGNGRLMGRQSACLACDSYHADALLPKGVRVTARAAGERYARTTRAEVARDMKDVKKMRDGKK